MLISLTLGCASRQPLDLIFSKDVTGEYWKCAPNELQTFAVVLLNRAVVLLKQLNFAKKFCSGSPDTGITFLNF